MLPVPDLSPIDRLNRSQTIGSSQRGKQSACLVGKRTANIFPYRFRSRRLHSEFDKTVQRTQYIPCSDVRAIRDSSIGGSSQCALISAANNSCPIAGGDLSIIAISQSA